MALWPGGCFLSREAKFKEAVILKISIFEWPRETRFLLEGKLAHEWVAEAEKAWKSIADASKRKHVVIDLCGVSFVDTDGERLLEKASAAGAILIGSNPMMRTLIDEIKSRTPKQPKSKKPVSLVMVVFLSLLLATLVVGCGLVY